MAAISARPGFDRAWGGGYGAPMTGRKLPIGIQTFREIREERNVAAFAVERA